MIPENSFLQGNDAADEQARLEALFLLTAIPCSLSPLTSCVQFFLFTDWRRTVLSKFFDTRVGSKEFVLSRHVRTKLSAKLSPLKNREFFMHR